MDSKKMMMNEDKSEDDLKSMTDSLDDYWTVAFGNEVNNV